MTAGSNFILCNKIGNKLPITLDHRISIINEVLITHANCIALSDSKYPLINATTANETPKSRPTTNSFLKILSQSLYLISSVAIPRIISVADWVPELPPVQVNKGINATNETNATVT